MYMEMLIMLWLKMYFYVLGSDHVAKYVILCKSNDHAALDVLLQANQRWDLLSTSSIL